MKAFSILALVFCTLSIGCKKVKVGTDGLDPSYQEKPAAHSAKPGCYADINVLLYQKVAGLEEPFPDTVAYNKDMAEYNLTARGYNVVGPNAHKQPDNVMISVLISMDFKKANIYYRQWSERNYPSVFPLDGDSLITTQFDVKLTAKSLEQAIEQSIHSMKTCSNLP